MKPIKTRQGLVAQLGKIKETIDRLEKEALGWRETEIYAAELHMISGLFRSLCWALIYDPPRMN